MSTSRDAVMARIRAALGPAPEVPIVPRAYRALHADGDVVARFCERAAEYRATVRVAESDDVARVLAEACAAHGTRRAVAAPGATWRPPGLELVVDDPSMSAAVLDGFDAALTGCALAIAETGTIVLDGGAASGRRMLTLVPDHHVCVVEAQQVVGGLPEAITALAPAARRGQPLTFVSGPSATSDIELERVEGVHGPRRLDIVVIAP
jgi:L-lactate dehydrogenase complex protein LldG